ncbi:MAG: ion channel [Myxococcota bacterium]|nr:ion channel [Myxococcota bacterium]
MASPDYEIRVLGAPKTPLGDFYHGIMRLSWTATILVIATAYLALNAVFGVGYLVVGGVEHARRGSWLDAFFFSVQTSGTIGYGAMWPSSNAANALVVVESVVSLVFAALATGLVFSKFSLPTARVMFSREATISRMDGVPTLAFRVGNQRSNRIVQAQVRVAMVRTEHTRERKVFYRVLDLTLVRERILSLSRSWTVLHVIDEKSPLWGETAESLAAKEVEIMVAIVGTDDLWMQSVHANHRYMHTEIAWGKRHADILSEESNALILDLRKFHDLEPAEWQEEPRLN